MLPDEDPKPPSIILNVNDNKHTLYLVTRILKAAKFEVWEAETGQEALNLAQKLPDLIILDVKLPDIDGLEVCRRIKTDPATRNISVIHLSAHRIKSEERVQGLDEGADAYLIQPVDSALLLATIKTVLRTRTAEQELRKTVARLEEERILRERFILTLSHDLRNPLSAARANAEIIQKFPEWGSKHVESARKIERSICRIDAMISDLLDANRIRAGEALPIEVIHCNLAQAIRETVDELISVHGHRFDLNLPENFLGYWSCDGIKRILENLIENGIKYGEPQSQISIALFQKGDRALISVHNKGVPLSFEEQSSIFDPFRRTTSAQASRKKGWGLGLTLVRGITEAHGGKVRLESSLNGGTTFFVELPMDARKS